MSHHEVLANAAPRNNPSCVSVKRAQNKSKPVKKNSKKIPTCESEIERNNACWHMPDLSTEWKPLQRRIQLHRIPHFSNLVEIPGVAISWNASPNISELNLAFPTLLRASFAPCRSACRWHRTGRPRRHLRWHLGVPEFLFWAICLGPIDCLWTTKDAKVYDLFYLSFHVRRNWDAKPRWDPRRACATPLGTDPRPERNESRLSAGRHHVQQ